MKVHRQPRTILFFLFLTIIATYGISFRIREINAREREFTNANIISYTVQEGDTLWGIAESTRFGIDTREVVRRIKELNNLDSCTIFPGQVLIIPIK